jgi:hypothetical protein
MFGTSLLAVALLAPAAPPEKPKEIDYEKQLNDKLSEGIRPEENAKGLLMLVFGPKPEGGTLPEEFYRRLGIQEPPENGDYMVSIGTFAKDHLQLDQDERELVYKQQAWSTKRPWKAADYPFIGAWLKINEKPLALVHEAVKRPKYYNPLVSKRSPQDPDGSLIGVLLPSVQKCRELVSLLAARAMLRTQEGKYDEAWSDIIACQLLARHVAHGGTLIELLVGVAIDSISSEAALAFLEHAKLDAKQVQSKLKDLQSLPPFPRVADKIDLTERMMFRDCLRLIRIGGIKNLEGLTGAGAGITLDDDETKGLARIDWKPAEAAGMKWYDRMVAALNKPTRAERQREYVALEAELKAAKEAHIKDMEKLRGMLKKGGDPGPAVSTAIGNVLISLLAPAVQKVQDASDRQIQTQGNLQTAFALKAYRLEHGKYPAKLDDLAPKYIPVVPGDTFNGTKLKYTPMKDGFLIWSVGANGKDEGGRFFNDEPRGDDPHVRFPLPPLKKE